LEVRRQPAISVAAARVGAHSGPRDRL